MGSLKSIIFAFSLLLPMGASGAIVVIDSSNLEDFSFSVKETPSCGDYWKTTMVVNGKKYFRAGCAGSLTSDTMVDLLDEVLKSPHSESCVIREDCWGNQCSRTYGTRQVNQAIKVIIDSKNEVTRFVDVRTVSSCQ